MDSGKSKTLNCQNASKYSRINPLDTDGSDIHHFVDAFNPFKNMHQIGYKDFYASSQKDDMLRNVMQSNNLIPIVSRISNELK